MWADIDGERKKVACGPCIRGHRSSKCDHRDRVLIEVRKPGRPLSSCPHPSGSCSCERVVVKYTIPKGSGCGACPSSAAQRVVPSSLSGTRVQKNRPTKASSASNASFEKALRANEQGDIDTASITTGISTNTSCTPSEKSASNGPSPTSSVSSTPYILPAPSRDDRDESHAFEVQLPEPHTDRTPTSTSQTVSACCQPKLQVTTQSQHRGVPAQGCCGSKPKETPVTVPVQKSCCSGKRQSSQPDVPVQMSVQPVPNQDYPQFQQFQQPRQFQDPSFAEVNQGFGHTLSGNMNLAAPFNTPIYNHMAPSYLQAVPSETHLPHGGHAFAGNSLPDPNCHCGDSCTCFGCTTHPKNSTMIDYVRGVNDFMLTDGASMYSSPVFDMGPGLHHAGYGGEVQQPMAFKSPPGNYASYAPSHMAFPTAMDGSATLHNSPFMATNSWQHTQPSYNFPGTYEPRYFNTTNPPREMGLGVKTEETNLDPTSQFADSPNDGEGGTTPTLSPSMYVWQELELPSCSDETGTCQCGDGCSCEGCLTHGGHNGVLSGITPPAIPYDFNDGIPVGNDGMHNFEPAMAHYAETPT